MKDLSSKNMYTCLLRRGRVIKLEHLVCFWKNSIAPEGARNKISFVNFNPLEIRWAIELLFVTLCNLSLGRGNHVLLQLGVVRSQST